MNRRIGKAGDLSHVLGCGLGRYARPLVAGGAMAGALLVIAALVGAPPARAEALKLAYLEGDYAGAANIWSADGKRVLGFESYAQHRQGDRLHIERVARFADGSHDEDTLDVRVGEALETIGGRTRLSGPRGKPIVDLRIDVAKKHIDGFYIDKGKREQVNRDIDIGPDTYWGPLFTIVVKNFLTNAKDNKVVVHSIAITPEPRLLDMEFVRGSTTTVDRPGGSMKTEQIILLPTVNFLVDPILHRFVPKTEFFVVFSEPPSMMRFSGPRNYTGQMIRIQ